MRSQQIATINANSVHMHDQPDTSNSGDILQTLNKGNIVTVLAPVDSGTWYTVHNTYSNTIGYIQSSYLDVTAVIQLILPDIYWEDAGGDPRWDQLYNDARYGGAIIKATEGTSYIPAAVAWFRYNWRLLQRIGGSSNGTQWFRSCYHYLYLNLPDSSTTAQQYGQKQAQYYLAILDSAGGLAQGDLPPIVDVETGGTHGEQVSNSQVEDITTAWAETVQAALGRKPMLYRRSQDTDFPGLTSQMGCSYLWAKRYNEELGDLTNGWNEAALWQYTDGQSNYTSYPSSPPGIGNSDSSVVLFGSGVHADPYQGLRALAASSRAVAPIA